MMHSAPAAPSAPPSVAQVMPPLLKSFSPPCAPSAITGTKTPIRKYATPTHSKARNGFPSSVCPLCRMGPYRPHESAAPKANITQIIDLFVSFLISLTDLPFDLCDFATLRVFASFARNLYLAYGWRRFRAKLAKHRKAFSSCCQNNIA